MSIGQHVIADLYEVAARHLVEGERVSLLLERELSAAGFTVLERSRQDFPGGGYTAMILLAESHASLHSYPEHRYLALDFFSCGTKDPQAVIDRFIKALGSPRVEQTLVKRGSSLDR